MAKFTNNELIKMVREQAKELGSPPTQREFKYHQTARYRFGSWSNFLTAAGLDPKMRKNLASSNLGKRYHQEAKNLLGKKFGKLTVIDFEKSGTKSRTRWLCKCDCGNTKIVYASKLLSGQTKSCGCLAKDAAILIDRKKRVEVEGTNLDKIRAKTNRNNTSGVKGVHYHKKSKKWVAQLNFKGKVVFREEFDTLKEATEARKEAEKKYFKPILEKCDYPSL